MRHALGASLICIGLMMKRRSPSGANIIETAGLVVTVSECRKMAP
jgi:hypothetical protein